MLNFLDESRRRSTGQGAQAPRSCACATRRRKPISSVVWPGQNRAAIYM